MTIFQQILLIITIIALPNQAQKQLCSVSKTKNQCFCSRITDNSQNTIITLADCTRIYLQNVPNPSELNLDITTLDLSHNQIVKLENKFSSIYLESLDLSYNDINYINGDFFSESPNLRKLSLSHNNISTLENGIFFKYLAKLTYLDLSFNNLKTLENQIFAPLIELQWIDLSYNDESLGGFLSKTSEFLSTDLGLNHNISHISLNHLGLKDLHNLYFDKFTNLKILSLADNHFETVPSVPYSVEYLDISGSDIEILQAKNFNYHSLKVLKLNRVQKLKSIHHYAFYNLQALEELSITDSRHLREFNELIFGLLTKETNLPLKKLTLARNSLETLNYTYKYLFRNLDHLDLRDNLWYCDCNLLWFQDVENFYKPNEIRCIEPAFLANREVLDLVDEDLKMCHPETYGKKAHRILIPVLILLVIILSALIGYLIYYAPHWYKNKGIGVGPESPYNSSVNT